MWKGVRIQLHNYSRVTVRFHVQFNSSNLLTGDSQTHQPLAFRFTSWFSAEEKAKSSAAQAEEKVIPMSYYNSILRQCLDLLLRLVNNDTAMIHRHKPIYSLLKRFNPPFRQLEIRTNSVIDALTFLPEKSYWSSLAFLKWYNEGTTQSNIQYINQVACMCFHSGFAVSAVNAVLSQF